MTRHIAAALIGMGLGLSVGSGVATAPAEAEDVADYPPGNYCFDLRDTRNLRTQRPSPIFCETPMGRWLEVGIHEPCPQWLPQPVWSPDGLWIGGGSGWTLELHPDTQPRLP